MTTQTAQQITDLAQQITDACAPEHIAKMTKEDADLQITESGIEANEETIGLLLSTLALLAE